MKTILEKNRGRRTITSVEKINETYNFFKECSDSKLIELIISGDENVSWYLIGVRYKKALYGVIGNSLGIYKKFSDYDLEYCLEKFYNYMISPKAITNDSKFKTLKNCDNIQSWLCQCCSCFLIHDSKQYISTVSINDYDIESVQTSEPYDDAEAKRNDVRNEDLKCKMLDFFVKNLSNRDLYIMLIYMLQNDKQLHIVHLDDKIADVLNQYHKECFSGSEVRKIRTRSIDKAKKSLKISKKYDFSMP
jgi:hypothetical protein